VMLITVWLPGAEQLAVQVILTGYPLPPVAPPERISLT
jgi:hypothetical protein